MAQLTITLTDEGEALTELIGELSQTYELTPTVVATSRRAGTRVRFSGGVIQLVLLAVSHSRTGLVVRDVARDGEAYVAHAEGQASVLEHARAYVSDIEGAEVRLERA